MNLFDNNKKIKMISLSSFCDIKEYNVDHDDLFTITNIDYKPNCLIGPIPQYNDLEQGNTYYILCHVSDASDNINFVNINSSGTIVHHKVSTVPKLTLGLIYMIKNGGDEFNMLDYEWMFNCLFKDDDYFITVPVVYDDNIINHSFNKNTYADTYIQIDEFSTTCDDNIGCIDICNKLKKFLERLLDQLLN